MLTTDNRGGSGEMEWGGVLEGSEGEEDAEHVEGDEEESIPED